MMLRVLLSILLLGILSLVQATWLGPVAILGVRPDLGLLAVVWLAYRNGPVEGCSSAFVSGLIDDALSAAPFGFNAAVKTLGAWLASFLHGAVQLDHVLMPLLLGAGATLFKALWASFLALLFGGRLETYDFAGRLLWIEVGYNALVAPFLFALLGLLFSLVDARRRRAA